MQRKQDTSTTQQGQHPAHQQGPTLEDNQDLFNGLFRAVGKRAAETGVLVELILVQMVHHISYELLLSDIPASHIHLATKLAEEEIKQQFRNLEAQIGGVQ
ncbi:MULTISPECIES: hypothetical protein [unclassified Pseudomonas]|uniref:hypothetical protein n=1 Tax=unclassified Pseudomonas TaxID=196821 RepID=UPI002448D6E6|nr:MULTISPECIES: hypothetical protein [unclassified Pseudomonas]MDH0304719.1 hypothetical protein [Pseudomonas sp. GD04091]MDH1986906.1 hypothetical protein [Pseudomonas sp. GD03689]